MRAPVEPANASRAPSGAAPPPAGYVWQRRLRALVRLLVRVFFRRLEVSGLENLPADRGAVLIAWHPNGLVDPALILSAMPHPVVFGARHGLFRLPVLGRVIAGLGTVPIYRREDAEGGERAGDEERRRRNEASLDALARRIAAGSFSALFPEGHSHDAPGLRGVKPGAARLYYRARSLTPAGRSPPALIPVGLHYDQKRVFRSRALVVFHPPLALPPELDVTPEPDASAEQGRELAQRLTQRIEEALRWAVLETESWELHALFHRARKLLRAERAGRAGAEPPDPSMEETVLGLARVWVAYRESAATRPEEVAALRSRVERYDRDLRALGVEDHELDRPPPVFRPGLWLIVLSQVASVFLLLPPLLGLGYLINLPTALFVSRFATGPGRQLKDGASLKLIAGSVLFPLTWAAWGLLAIWAARHPWVAAWAPWLPERAPLAALAVALLGVVSGVVMLVYVELARATWRALRVRLTRGLRARTFLRLRVERGRLCDALLAFSAGLELPGRVERDGRISGEVAARPR